MDIDSSKNGIASLTEDFKKCNTEDEAEQPPPTNRSAKEIFTDFLVLQSERSQTYKLLEK